MGNSGVYMGIDCYFLENIQNYLEKNGKLIKPTQASIDKKAGEKNSLSIHIKYMIYAQLSNQEKWSNVEKNFKEIDAVFFQYNINEIRNKTWEYFYEKIKPLINRGLSLKGQMKKLHSNITTLEKINNENDGGLDAYVISKSPKEIIKSFINENKLYYMGVSLVCEYLKSVGVECAKPDTHIMRFLSKTRRGFLKKDEAYISKKNEKKETIWTDPDKIKALDIIEIMGKKSGKTASEIDRIIWSYCADSYGEICTKTPNCNSCIVRDGCNHNKKSGVQF
jgi:hypothetical protein